MTSHLLPLLVRLSYVESDLRMLGELGRLHQDETAVLIARQATQHLKAVQVALEEPAEERQPESEPEQPLAA